MFKKQTGCVRAAGFEGKNRNQLEGTRGPKNDAKNGYEKSARHQVREVVKLRMGRPSAQGTDGPNEAQEKERPVGGRSKLGQLLDWVSSKKKKSKRAR